MKVSIVKKICLRIFFGLLFFQQEIQAEVYEEFICPEREGKKGVKRIIKEKLVSPEVLPDWQTDQKGTGTCYGCTSTYLLQAHYFAEEKRLSKNMEEIKKTRFSIPHVVTAGRKKRATLANNGGRAFSVLQIIKSDENYTVLRDQGQDIENFFCLASHLDSTQEVSSDSLGSCTQMVKDFLLPLQVTQFSQSVEDTVCHFLKKDKMQAAYDITSQGMEKIKLPAYNVHLFEPHPFFLLESNKIKSMAEYVALPNSQQQELLISSIREKAWTLFESEPAFPIEFGVTVNGGGHSLILKGVSESCCEYPDGGKICEDEWIVENSYGGIKQGRLRARPFLENFSQFTYITACEENGHENEKNEKNETKTIEPKNKKEKCTSEIQTLQPLHALARTGDVKALAQYPQERLKAELHQINSAGFTPLHTSVLSDDPATIRKFIKEGFHPNTPDFYNTTPLMVAILSEQELSMETLIQEGVSVDGLLPNGETPLAYAINKKKLKAIRKLIKLGAKAVDQWGTPPLFMAIENKDFSLFSTMVEARLDVNSVRNDGLSVLGKSLLEEDFASFSYLLKNNVDVQSPDQSKKTPLIYAAFSRSPIFTKGLLAKGAHINVKNSEGETALSLAAQLGSLGVVKAIVENTDPNNQAQIDLPDNEGETPLMKAIIQQRFSVVDYLLSKGANLHAKNLKGETPLMLAAKAGHSGLSNFLLEKGADPAVLNKKGKNALDLATKNGCFRTVIILRNALRGNEEIKEDVDHPNEAELLKTLTAAGASKENMLFHAARGGYNTIVQSLLQDENLEVNDRVKILRTTPLVGAAMGSNTQAIKLLLDKGAEVNSDDEDGRTALSYMAEFGESESVETLLAHSAEVDRSDVRNMTPLQYATLGNKIPVIASLIKAGANIHHQNNQGDTPVYLAIYKKDEQLLDALMKSGQNINTPSRDGSTPLFKAIQMGAHQLVEKLLKAGADPKIKDNAGDSALSMAVYNYQKNPESIKNREILELIEKYSQPTEIQLR